MYSTKRFSRGNARPVSRLGTSYPPNSHMFNHSGFYGTTLILIFDQLLFPCELVTILRKKYSVPII